MTKLGTLWAPGPGHASVAAAAWPLDSAAVVACLIRPLLWPQNLAAAWPLIWLPPTCPLDPIAAVAADDFWAANYVAARCGPLPLWPMECGR
jgi:hypothetical protein